MYRAPSETACNDTFLRLVAEGNPALSRVATDRGIIHHPFPGMGCARRLCQNITFKADYAFDSGMPQWLARCNQAFAPLRLERLFLGRHRFYHFRVWFRDELAGYLREVILDAKTRRRPHFRGNYLEGLLKDHLSGKRNYTTEIQKALTLELIQRQLLERNWN